MSANEGTWIDIHAHLNMLEHTPEQVLKLAKDVGVQKVITIGTEPADHQFVLDTSENFAPDIYCTLGVHPHEATKFDESVLKFLRTNCVRPNVVGVGEIGLDYYYDNSPRDIQKEVFKKQLQLSIDLDLPVQIHTRDAEPDTVEILSSFGGKVKGVIHCFTGSMWLAKEVLQLGMNISFSGIITFKSADELREVVKIVPLDRLHVETDSPFLTPVPERGKKNSPDRVLHTARKVCELKGVSMSELSEQTNLNAKSVFPKIQWH